MSSLLEPVIIEDADQLAFTELRHQLSARADQAVHEIRVPDKVYRLLFKIVDDLADGKAVSLTAAAQEMTTQAAADYLGMSRQFLVRLLDQGRIPFHRVGTHRRVYLEDLNSFRKERDGRRHKAIEEMARAAVNDGVYDSF